MSMQLFFVRSLPFLLAVVMLNPKDVLGDSGTYGNWPPESYPLSEVTITLERTACLGTCPVYTLNVYGDGRIVYDGREHVEVKGRREATIAVKHIEELLNAIYWIPFFDLRNDYSSGHAVSIQNGWVFQGRLIVTDTSNTTVSVKLGDYGKSVRDSFHAPQGLKNFANKMDELADTSRWVGTQTAEE